MIVAALSPAAGGGRRRPRPCPSSVRSMTSRVGRVDVERVLVARPTSPGRRRDRVGVDARAPASTSDAPCLPNRRSSASRGSAARSPIVRTPKSRSAAAVRSPTPHSREIGSGARNAASSPGGTTTSPSGLRRSEPILATSLVAATPTDAVSPTSSRIVVLDQPRDRLAVAEQLPRARARRGTPRRSRSAPRAA